VFVWKQSPKILIQQVEQRSSPASDLPQLLWRTLGGSSSCYWFGQLAGECGSERPCSCHWVG